MKEFLVNDTIPVSWVNSGGGDPTSLYVHLLTSSGTSVSSTAFVSSGAGQYGALVTLPSVYGIYAVKSVAVINGKPYHRSEIIKLVEETV